MFSRHTSWVRLLGDGGRVILAEGTEALTVENASLSDSGLYACVVGTDDEASYQEVALLNVTRPNLVELAPPHDPALVPVPSTAAGEGVPGHHHMSVIAGTVSVLAAVLLVAILYVFRRYKRERFKKQQAIANAHSITQWTKKVRADEGLLLLFQESILAFFQVIIERQSQFDPEAAIVAPVIRIEKRRSTSSVTNVNNHNSGSGGSNNRSRLGSENTTLTTISEYELPLDPTWEFPR